MWKKISPLKKRLYMLVLVCLAPLIVMILYLLITINRFSDRYDAIVSNITMANTYNINFKEDMDYIMYIIAVNAERAEELVDMEQPHIMIDDARKMFQKLYEITDEEYPKNQLKRILKNLNTLEDRVEEIEEDAFVIGTYDLNMERLDVNIRILTNLIQEQIQTYIYYQATNLEVLRGDIRTDVNRAIRMVSIVFTVILAAVFFINRKIMTGITEPIQNLCEVTKVAGSGDFGVRAREESGDELELLSISFNRMVEQIGNLVEDIRIEQMNLKATELKLLQAQINPHFLYNTLSAINWMAIRSNQKEISKVTLALSTFYRTALSKGEDMVTVENCIRNVEAYLEIQLVMHDHDFTVQWETDPFIKNEMVPKLLLQPVVENALEHGLDVKEEGEKIMKLSIVDEGEEFLMAVTDNGPGMDPEKAKTLVTYQAKGYGLKNVNDRIRLLYGEEYGVRIISHPGEGTRVEIRLPKKTAAEREHRR